MTEPLADQASDISKKMNENMKERMKAIDIDQATDEWLDMHGRRAGVVRTSSESDYAFRNRIKEAVK